MNMGRLAGSINALCDLVSDQAKQHAHPVCAWIHSFHELDKLTPWDIKNKLKHVVIHKCFPNIAINQVCCLEAAIN